MSRAALSDLRALVGPDALLTNPDATSPYLVDERRLFQGRALAVALPASTADLARIVGYCHAHGIPMVPQGGNTGYCGGATPDTTGRALVIALSRLCSIRRIDRVSGAMIVDAGLSLREAQLAAERAHMFFPLSMGSELTSQIGGVLSTNAGGLAVLRYGTARDLVLGLEVVLPDGRVLDQLSALRKNNTGYDVKQWFIGAEGTLGIITAAALRLFPWPTRRETALCAVRDLDAACAMLAGLRDALGDSVTSFEYFTADALALVLAHVPDVRSPFESDHRHYVLVEVSGGEAFDSLGEALQAACARLQDEGIVQDGVIATSAAQRAAFWRLREQIPAGERAVGGSVKHDVSVEIAELPRLATRARAAVEHAFPGCRFSVYGHVGDGNLHFNVLAPEGLDADAFRHGQGPAISTAVHDAAVALGGSFSAEHGVGQLKRDLLAQTKSPVALALMRSLKQTLDPKGLMNPGKVL
ncbi:MAG: FAD-binding oxidoreductase [Gammaproteobacteria bacterium]